MLDRDRIAREVYGMHGGYDGARLARTVLTLHRELAVLRAQLPPLCAVHDALVAAAALRKCGCRSVLQKYPSAHKVCRRSRRTVAASDPRPSRV